MWRPEYFISSSNTYWSKKKGPVKLKRRKDKYPKNPFRSDGVPFKDYDVIRYWPDAGRLKIATSWSFELRFVFEDNGPTSRMRNPPKKASPKKRNGLWG